MGDYYNDKGILNDARFDINWDVKKYCKLWTKSRVKYI